MGKLVFHDPHRPDADARRVRMRERVAWRVSELEKRNVFSSNDLSTIARNMWSLTQRVRRKHNLSQEDIYSCTVEDGSKGTKASKNARYYELPPHASAKRYLTKRPAKYFRVLKEISHLTRGSENFFDLAEELLGTTVLAPSGNTIDNTESDHVSLLVDQLNALAARIESACKVSTYFKQLSRKLVSYDVRSDQFYTTERYDTLVDEIQIDPTDPWEICSDEAPPWPSLPLFREILTPKFPCAVLSSNSASCWTDRAGRRWAREISGDAARHVAFASLWMEVRLTIAPVAPHASAKPIFELRFPTRLENDDGQIRVLNEYTYWSGDPNIGAINMHDVLIPALLTADIPDSPGLDHLRFKPSEFCYFLYLPITDEITRVLLDRPISPETEYSFGGLTPSTTRLPVLFPHGSLGSLVEHTLLNPEQAGFDLSALLEKDARSKIAHFCQLYEPRHQAILRTHQDRLDGKEA
ncbi:hypothetical protein JQ615_25335 [Bradyrhizobium jicamae]|uniref:Uncharacterized protein n=1 Tax=Bradyrhizobium jicamae TaxID=280332 RepID=A0ABS5FPL8_9BRAD|nr:hypothetical protein [Bradyrhizobium jicamae]MBR0798717.1 hypothetical protein [Bradyrhizobium jicamae]